MTIKLNTTDIRQKLPNTEVKKGDRVSTKVAGEGSGLLEVAKDFSSLFFDTVLQSMRKSVMKSDFLKGGHAEDMYQSMLDSEYAKIIAKQDQTGLAKMIADQLSQSSNTRWSTPAGINNNHAIEAYGIANPKQK